MADTITVVKTNDPLIDGLLYKTKWNLGLLTFGFPTKASQYGGADYAYDDDNTAPFVPNTNEAATMTPLALDMRLGIGRAAEDLAGFTTLELLRLPNNLGGSALLRFAETTSPRAAYASNTAYANWPDDIRPGDAWFDTGAFSPAPVGSYQYAVGIHEFGHLLGLKHGHEVNGVAKTALPAAWNSTEFSIMTYASYIGDNTGNDWNHAVNAEPQGWMMLDIRALQYLYGVDYTYRADNTTYRFDPGTGELKVNGVSQGVPGSNIIFRTIWDGGGTDTYDFSAYGADRQMRIDLRPGDPGDPDTGWTDVDAIDDTDPRPNMPSTFQAANLGGGPNGGFARGQVANAMMVNGDTRSLIENAIAGAGDDTVIGNQADNWLRGGAGDDVLLGFYGSDTLQGGAGQDHLDGGAGFDMASFADAPQGLTIDLAFDRGDGSFGKVTAGGVDTGDTFVSIEDIEGSGYDDRLFGWAGLSTRILGGEGHDSIDGRGGGDIIDAGLGNDTVVAYGGDYSFFDGGLTLDPFDLLIVGGTRSALNWATQAFSIDGQSIFRILGFEMVQGGAGGDSLTADARDMSFYGNAGNDTLFGGSGDNVLEGGAGADLLFFGAGFDYADYRSDTAGVLADIRSGIVGGGHAAGDGWLDSPEGLMGGAGNDSLGGSEADNRILGRAGNDYASGYAGRDTLDGGEGHDSLEGGTGADQLFGAEGNDILGDAEQVLLMGALSDAENDTLQGGEGDDTLLASGGDDSLDGGTGGDALVGGAGADRLAGGDGDDRLSDHTQRTASDESLLSGFYAASDADTLLGGRGDDTIFSGGGGDLIDGGLGIDRLLMDFSSQAAALSFTMATGALPWTILLGGIVTATVSGIESLSLTAGGGADQLNASRASFYVTLQGGDGKDMIRGGASGDVLDGGAGTDRILGNAGDDYIVGGAGRDTLTGGLGRDIFRYDSSRDGGDVITDFTSGIDKLMIYAPGFQGGLADGTNLAAEGRFVPGSAPTAPWGQFLYSSGRGMLSWDIDGTGAKAAVPIASLGANTVLAASDFIIVG